jgi:hypothetical protein
MKIVKIFITRGVTHTISHVLACDRMFPSTLSKRTMSFSSALLLCPPSSACGPACHSSTVRGQGSTTNPPSVPVVPPSFYRKRTHQSSSPLPPLPRQPQNTNFGASPTPPVLIHHPYNLGSTTIIASAPHPRCDLLGHDTERKKNVFVGQGRGIGTQRNRPRP